MDLHEFSKLPDESLSENINQSNSSSSNNYSRPIPPIQADIFNSAGNTRLSDIEDPAPHPGNTDPANPAPKGKLVLGKLISGKATVSLVNIFIPSFIVFALRKFNYSANKSQLKLTKEEQEILAPVMQDCLDYIEVNFDNPFYALAFVATMVYGSKVMDIVPDLQKIKNSVVDDIIEETNNAPIVKMPYRKDQQEEQEELIVRNDKPVTNEIRELREKIDRTTIRKEKVRLIVEFLTSKAPTDLIEMFDHYGGIYPERNENYFRKWYDNNYEAFPIHLQFGAKPQDEEFNIEQ